MLSVICVGVGPGRYVGENEGVGVAFLSEAGGVREKEGVRDRELELSWVLRDDGWLGSVSTEGRGTSGSSSSVGGP